MNSIAVIYFTNYGTTEQYAKWIGEETDADVIDGKNVTIDQLNSYDTIIFGGALYASGISGAKFETQHFDELKEKNLIVFTVGVASTNRTEVFVPILDKNFSKEMQDTISFYHLRGGINYNKLNTKHRAMMWMLKNVLARKKPEDLSEDDVALLETYGDVVDFSNRSTIRPLIEMI